MNFGQNKFFIGLGIAVLLGCGSLGFLLLQALSNYNAADALYTEQLAKLTRLQTLPLYPEPSNLAVLEAQNKTAHETAVALHQQLVRMAFPLEPMTPEQFQDKLNTSVKNLVEKAAAAGVKLSDKFYLGFTEYRTATPRPEAAAVLGRQLKCIELVVNTMIDKKVTSIGEVVRTHLDEEADPTKTAAGQPIPPQGKAKLAKPVLLSKYPFEVPFVSEQKAFQGVLNDLSKTEQQFFIIRPVVIKNQNEKAPKKNDPNAEKMSEATATAAAAPINTGAGATAPALRPEKMRYVLGAEKLNVTLRFDAVIFTSNLPK